MANENEYSESSIKLYLSYDYLTIEQYANILSAVNKVYSGLANSLIFGDFNYYNSPYVISYPIPLCIEEMRTGNSIEAKFSFKKRFFPKIKYKDDQLNIILPEWSGVVIIAGALLYGGLSTYNLILDTRLKQQQINAETEKVVREQVILLDDLRNKNAPTVLSVQEGLAQFNSQIYQRNIKEVSVDGEKISRESR